MTRSSQAELGCEACLSCNACQSICTIHVASNRLVPLRLLRMSKLGLRERLIESPELWYCLQCNRCSQTCPMAVRPSVMIRELRREAMARGLVSSQAVSEWEELLARFQRVRWHMLSQRATGERLEQMAEAWEQWAQKPIEAGEEPILFGDAQGMDESLVDRLAGVTGYSVDLGACMTCGACSTVCPASHDRDVFDPVVMFRLANLGQWEAVSRSPGLWMCLACGACTEACTQQVRGDVVLRGLQSMALEQGVAPRDMRERVWEVDRVLYPRQIDEVDRWHERATGNAVRTG